eukprot:3589136-Pyramimonas_sp.AAC.1
MHVLAPRPCVFGCPNAPDSFPTNSPALSSRASSGPPTLLLSSAHIRPGAWAPQPRALPSLPATSRCGRRFAGSRWLFTFTSKGSSTQRRRQQILLKRWPPRNLSCGAEPLSAVSHAPPLSGQ